MYQNFSDGEGIQGVDWSIENISDWHQEIHKKKISMPQLGFFDWDMKLFPRGPSGEGEYLVVQVKGDRSVTSAELSFIGSDGSELSSQLINGYNGRMRVLEIFSRLKFRDIVAQNKMNEELYEDKLTLRWRWKTESPYESMHFRRTKMVVFDTTLKIPLEAFDSCKSSRYELGYFSKIEFTLKDFFPSYVYLFASKSRQNDSDVELALAPTKVEGSLLVSTRVSLLSNDGTVCWTEENEQIFRYEVLWTFLYSLSTDRVPKDGFYLLLRVKIVPKAKVCNNPNDVLSLYSKKMVSMTTSNFRLRSMDPKESFWNPTDGPGNSATVLSEELKGIYTDQHFTDFVLRCGNMSFRAHKNILSARSPVFNRLLCSDMKEASSGCMDIPDLDGDTLRRFLVFLYTGTADDLQGERALKLYYAADKYQVPTLRRDCAKALSANLSVSNVCQILSLADKHHDEQLLSVVHQFILGNYSDVLGSKEWKTFMHTDPNLLMKTVVHFAKNKLVTSNR